MLKKKQSPRLPVTILVEVPLNATSQQRVKAAQSLGLQFESSLIHLESLQSEWFPADQSETRPIRIL